MSRQSKQSKSLALAKELSYKRQERKLKKQKTATDSYQAEARLEEHLKSFTKITQTILNII